MDALQSTLRWLKWLFVAMAGLLALGVVAIAGIAASIDAGLFREPVLRFLAARAQHEIRVLGPLQLRLLARHPSLTAQRVVIYNPPWMPAGILAEIGTLELDVEMPSLAEPLRLRRITLQSAAFTLLRDESGKANWRSTPARMGNGGPPLMDGLSVRDARVRLNDERRHLTFDGTVSAVGSGTDRLRIDATGQLNRRPATLAIDADPLGTARHDTPYRFRFEERSSGSTLAGEGALARPYDLRELQATLHVSGADLKDLYYLVGLKLPDTGAYRVSATLQRSGLEFSYTNVRGQTGETDIAGTVTVDSSNERTQLTADLHSDRLRRADLGKRAAGRAAERTPGQPLLSRTPIDSSGLRRSDARIRYRARSVDLGALQLNTLAAQFTVDHGVVAASPVTAKFADGSLSVQGKLDAAKDLLAAQLALNFEGLQLGQLHRRKGGPPPVAGPLRGKARLVGKGHSLHELAASAEGSIAVALPEGALQASLAELGGLDFRALGLMLSGRQTTTPVRCAVAAFDVHEGTLTSSTLALDTESVLITGAGTVDLKTEALDLQFRGRPKHPRLRLRTRLVAHGTLSQPVFGLEADRTVAQAAAGVALGVLLTPLAAGAAFVDLGRAKDADCPALMAAQGW